MSPQTGSGCEDLSGFKNVTPCVMQQFHPKRRYLPVTLHDVTPPEECNSHSVQNFDSHMNLQLYYIQDVPQLRPASLFPIFVT